ncbi:MAG: hypothetical protein R3F62_03045 [Planctomycetota bacterium]
MDNSNALVQQVTLRVADPDVEQIERISESLPLKRSAIIRAALRLGLRQLESDPTLLLQAHAQPLIETPAHPWKTL